MKSVKDFFGSLFGRHAGGRAAGELYKKGDRIGGKYEVYGLLGKGGFGIVYLVYSHETREVVALKTFRDEFLADGAAREAFKKEALLWVSLEEHPFILAARWVQEIYGRLFVAMNYIAPDEQGRVSLADHLARASGPMDTDQALRWAIQFCLGMEHANIHSIKCHRDIKPGNILITQDGTLKIADFGLAAAAEATGRGQAAAGSLATGDQAGGFGFSLLLTEGRRVCGTPGYIPPEVYRGEGADARSDIYSFGLVLWQMATGSSTPPFVVPYRGNMEAYLKAVYERQMTGPIQPVNGVLGPVIARCLAPEPTKRYEDFAELRVEVEKHYRQRTGKSLELPVVQKTAAFWNNKGCSLAALGRHQEAISCYDRALALDPRDAAAWSNKGRSLAALGRREEAIRCYDRALELDPRDAATWNNKGTSLHALGRREEAIGCYDRALELDPRDAKAWNNKGNSLDALGRCEEAIRCYDRALELDPRNVPAWNNKGVSLNALGRHEEAIGCFDRALELEPRDADAWFSRAFAEEEVGRSADAISSYRKFIEVAPPQDAQRIALARQWLRLFQQLQ